MTASAYDLQGVRVLECAADGPTLSSDGDATDVVGLAFEHRAGLVVLPVERLGEAFFRLGSGVAGAVLQKFINYGLRVAIVGDVSSQVGVSQALRDFVYESNRGRHVCFAASLDELDMRLKRERSRDA